VIYEWDPKKAKANLRKHGMSFEEAATVFLDPLAVTYPDPDHSGDEIREITIGHSAKRKVVFLSHTQRGDRIRIIARERQPQGSANNMKKASAKKNNNDLRPEYDLSKLKGGVRGKYYRQATAGTNLVLIDPELTEIFPDTESVNRALRLLADTAASATGRKRTQVTTTNKRLKRSA